MATKSQPARKKAKKKPPTSPVEKGVKAAQDVFKKILAIADPKKD